MELLFVFVVYVFICYLIAKEGAKRKIGFNTSLVLSLIISPLIGGIVTMMSAKVK